MSVKGGKKKVEEKRKKESLRRKEERKKQISPIRINFPTRFITETYSMSQASTPAPHWLFSLPASLHLCDITLSQSVECFSFSCSKNRQNHKSLVHTVYDSNFLKDLILLNTRFPLPLPAESLAFDPPERSIFAVHCTLPIFDTSSLMQVVVVYIP